jgi:hypothetical protein
MKSSFKLVVATIAAISLAYGCGAPSSESPTTSSDEGRADFRIFLEPAAELTEAESVLSIHIGIQGDPATSTFSDLALIEGSPSAVSVGKYEDGETTDALAERMVPHLVYQGVDEIQLRPTGVLALGQTYTLLSRGGVAEKFVVMPQTSRPYWARIWPPTDTGHLAYQVLYCGSVASVRAAEVELFPPGVTAQIQVGLDDAGSERDHCLRLVPERPRSIPALPPVMVNGVALEPTRLEGESEPPELVAQSCNAQERAFGPGCLSSANGQLTLRGPKAATLWFLTSPMGKRVEILEPGARAVVPVIGEFATVRLEAVIFDVGGRSQAASTDVEVPKGAPRVIINEVLANANGSEPEEEWIELLNAGSALAELRAWKLADGGGQVEIPALVLEPGAFVILANEGFVGGQAGDVAPAERSTVIRLSTLAKGGLSNAGEVLRLLDENGEVRSSFPARQAARAGVSLARANPDALDDDAKAFLSHAPPGASPGARNEVE